MPFQTLDFSFDICYIIIVTHSNILLEGSAIGKNVLSRLLLGRMCDNIEMCAFFVRLSMGRTF